VRLTRDGSRSSKERSGGFGSSGGSSEETSQRCSRSSRSCWLGAEEGEGGCWGWCGSGRCTKEGRGSRRRCFQGSSKERRGGRRCCSWRSEGECGCGGCGGCGGLSKETGSGCSGRFGAKEGGGGRCCRPRESAEERWCRRRGGGTEEGRSRGCRRRSRRRCRSEREGRLARAVLCLLEWSSCWLRRYSRCLGRSKSSKHGRGSRGNRSQSQVDRRASRCRRRSAQREPSSSSEQSSSCGLGCRRRESSRRGRSKAR
jgi:hypothetical protein